MTEKILKRITAATVLAEIGLKPVDFISGKADLEKTHAYRLFGVVRSLKPGSTQYGPFIGFVGEFVAQFGDGLTARANRCFLPRHIETLIEQRFIAERRAVWESANKGTPEAQRPPVATTEVEVRFAMDVAIQRKNSLAVGYEYDVQPVIETSRVDPLAELMAMAGAAKALPAPAKTAAPKK